MSDNQTKLGVAPNVGGLLCNVPCCVGLIFSIVAVIVEKDNKFLRFHAVQSLLLHAAILVSSIAFWFAGLVAGMILWLLAVALSVLSFLVFLGFVGVQILMMIKANNNEEYNLPVIGDMARQWV